MRQRATSTDGGWFRKHKTEQASRDAIVLTDVFKDMFPGIRNKSRLHSDAAANGSSEQLCDESSVTVEDKWELQSSEKT